MPTVQALGLVWQSGRLTAVISVLVTLLQGVLPAVPVLVVKLIVDAITAGGDVANVMPLVVILGTSLILTAILRSVSIYVREAQSQRLSDHVQAIIHAKSLELDLSYYETTGYFDKLHRAQQEAPYRPAQVVENLTTMVRSAMSVAGIAGVMIYALPWYTVVILVVSAVPPMVVRLVSSRKYHRWKTSRTTAERHVNYLNWLITGRVVAKDIRLFGLGNLLSRRAHEWRDRLRNERLRLVGRRAIGDVVASGIQAVTLAGLLAYFVVQSIASASLGDLVLFLQAVQRGQQALTELLQGFAQLYETNLFLENVFEFMHLESSLVQRPDGTGPHEERRGFEVRDVSFSYPGSSNQVLRDVSISAPPGRLVVILGDNGAGKTTLIKLMCRFYDPTAGTVRFNGRDIRGLDPDDYRLRMSVIFQDPGQFYYSAAENIWYGDVEQEPDMHRVEEAARRVQAHEFIAALPKQYDTSLGRWLEDGAELSGGQWKKLALARTLYRPSDVMILDEPTAGLDPDSEAAFIRMLPDLAGKRCVIVVSHKIAAARIADDVYVMRDGCVIEHGNHDELVARGGYYAGLYEVQLRQIHDVET